MMKVIRLLAEMINKFTDLIRPIGPLLGFAMSIGGLFVHGFWGWYLSIGGMALVLGLVLDRRDRQWR